MTEIKFAIEGEEAILATEELLAIEGITGDYTADSEDVRKEAVITTVATIVGIVGGTMAIAEQIRKWYQEYKQKQSGKKIAKVLIVGRNGRRLLLENATIEEIRQILES
jgi:DNA-binding transcriptional regulator YbjK